METICLNDVKKIISLNGGAHVSIFIPTHHKGGADQQDPIRLRKLLRVAEEKLTARGLRAAESRSILKPAESLLTDNLFWRQQSDGLALFINPDIYFYYRVPINLNEEVGVGERFYIKPLVSLLSACGWFYVLAVSQDEVRLLQCTAVGSVRKDLVDTPKNIDEALRLDTHEGTMQYHTAAPTGGSNLGGVSGIQTGAPSKANYLKDNMVHYFNRVNKGIIKTLRNEKAPLVLAGVDYLHPLYRKANTYPNLLSEGIMGNPDGVSDDTLREQAWTIVQPHFNRAQQEAVAEYRKSAGTGLTAAGFSDVIPAAYHGRVRFLFAVDKFQQWGTYNPEDNSPAIHKQPEPDDEDLMDLAAFQTLNHAGTIYAMKQEEVPGNAPLSAILRF